MFKREVAVLHFQVLDEPYIGTPLERYYPIKKKIGRNSTYLREWIIANQDRPPSRRDRLPLSKFVGKVFRVCVGSVEKSWDGRRHPAPLQYSVVRAILALEATNERVRE